jgi:hypothetical protein
MAEPTAPVPAIVQTSSPVLASSSVLLPIIAQTSTTATANTVALDATNHASIALKLTIVLAPPTAPAPGTASSSASVVSTPPTYMTLSQMPQRQLPPVGEDHVQRRQRAHSCRFCAAFTCHRVLRLMLHWSRL